jgi:hypothetical protein
LSCDRKRGMFTTCLLLNKQRANVTRMPPGLVAFIYTNHHWVMTERPGSMSTGESYLGAQVLVVKSKWASPGRWEALTP